jgi:uncharacterized protein YceK
MKKLTTFLLLLTMGILFSGCGSMMTTTTKNPDGSVTTTEQPGSMWGPSSYDVGYQGMFNSFSDSKTKRAEAIKNIPPPADPIAAAYFNGMQMMGIAMMSMERFEVKAPVTGFDVMYKLTDSIVPVAGFYSLYKLGVSGIQGAGSTLGNNNTLTNSFNPSNPSATNIGAGSAGATSNSTPASTPTSDSFNVTNPLVTP